MLIWVIISRLLLEPGVNRAVVLLGPRRVGKTILVYHAIQELIDRQAVSGRDILYV
ncbi:AAA family ATPase, partial [Thiolapillus sp.]|uniref:AAA family ATPase n=1 Tax=Thiolapillus sp. TaxID=2017437 RepID=UPI0035B1E944